MKDPFPFGPGFLADAVRPLADALGLETLPNHIHEVILSTLFFHVIHVYISPWLSTRLFPNSYPKLPYKSRLNWDVHTVSLVQSTVIDVGSIQSGCTRNETDVVSGIGTLHCILR